MSLRTLPLPKESHRRSRRRGRLLRGIFRKSVLQALFLCFFCYALIYIFLSAGGRWQIARERVIWNPYGLRFDFRRNDENRLIARGSFFGYLFAPLVVTDRMVFHRSFPTDSDEGRLVEQRERQAKEHEWLQNK